MTKRKTLTVGQRRKNLARLQREYREFKKRSDASKRGWVTRRFNEQYGGTNLSDDRVRQGLGLANASKEEDEPLTITRLKYKGKKSGHSVNIEVVRRGGRIESVRVGKRSYSSSHDIAMLGSLLASAEPDDDGSG